LFGREIQGSIKQVEVAIMMTKTKVALAAALLLGVATAAQAGTDHRSLARGAYAHVPAQAQSHETGTPAAKEPAYMEFQDRYADQND
jgi:hypothetical protein